ncbi:MAG TPA: type II toxin-antitoxin system HicB family antitoxin [Saprospiraceae bacterium]|nr:type II toxin-antitoxin system HicB family antitoxin [Saprospiraceae bacterium]
MQVLKGKNIKNKKIVFSVEKTDTGFSAYTLEFPVFTSGKTIQEVINNAYEAANLYFEDINFTIEPDNIKFEIDFKQFFKYYKIINAKFLGKKIGMNPTLLSQYISGDKKPSSKQTEKILRGIHQIGQELIGIHLLQ